MKVSQTFKIRTMGEYQDLNLKSDTLLLADVFENFRKNCLQYYKLDSCHYFTSPALSWDAMLKMIYRERYAWWYFIYCQQTWGSQ